jgi:2-polyprenyl-3-methyl-5-hydroxy-6-metoxy-1,4-benzoquinol methylase
MRGADAERESFEIEPSIELRNMLNLGKAGHRLRLLVGIASYGEKHLGFLKQIAAEYRSMTMDVDVVVFSEAPKELGSEVEVAVGLPSGNPWSLPFAHKRFFAENIEKYDLFIYSEDDILCREANIEAFLQISPALAENEIAGFLLYEVDRAGEKSLANFHGCWHWKPESVRQRGSYTVAEFTNEHSAFYLLTQTQLKKAIASGGFLREPYEGRHDMLCAAATDPYTGCGFRKVICISAIKEFLLHHLPNRYVGTVGLDWESFSKQIEILSCIHKGVHPASTLCEVETKMRRTRWFRDYYEPADDAVLRQVPETAKSVLSVGCSWGAATEVKLKRRGTEVTALPLDSVIGAATARLGIEVVYGTLADGLKKIDGRRFDSVLVSNLVYLQPNPAQFLVRCSRCLQEAGTLVVCGPNFDHVRTLANRVFGAKDYRKLRSFDQSGISVCGPRRLASPLKRAGLRIMAVQWINHEPWQIKWIENRKHLGCLTARNWIIQARR